jgi:hypothetical protein
MRDNPPMHTLIAYANAPGPRCQQALARLKLPNLTRLLQRLSPAQRWHAEPHHLTPVHELVLAHAAGLSGADGLIPWAAHEAQTRGLTTLHGPDGWAWITPCHWKVHANHVEMANPAHLALTPHDANALFHAMQPYFAEDGITLFAPAQGQPCTRWLAMGAVFTNLPTASMDRVAGKIVDPWIPREAQAKPLRRLQNEMQMLLYTHQVNDQRGHFQLPSVNAFWASGTGSLAPLTPSAAPATPFKPLTSLSPMHSPTTSPTHSTVHDILRSPALQDDAAAWGAAWHALDASTLAHDLQRLQQGEPVQITVCSDNQALTLRATPLSQWERLRRRMLPPQTNELLKSL